jgi:hypothetical protein
MAQMDRCYLANMKKNPSHPVEQYQARALAIQLQDSSQEHREAYHIADGLGLSLDPYIVSFYVVPPFWPASQPVDPYIPEMELLLYLEKHHSRNNNSLPPSTTICALFYNPLQIYKTSSKAVCSK